MFQSQLRLMRKVLVRLLHLILFVLEPIDYCQYYYSFTDMFIMLNHGPLFPVAKPDIKQEVNELTDDYMGSDVIEEEEKSELEGDNPYHPLFSVQIYCLLQLYRH